VVLNSLFNDDSFGELLFWSLVMNAHGSSVQDFLFTETEPVIAWVKLPVVIAVLLLSWSKIAVGLFVHVRNFSGFLLATTVRVQ